MNTKLLLSCGAASLALTFQLATAQEDASDSDRKVLETVTVSAQQRDQNAQDVPITLQVISDKNIDILAADDIGDLDTFIPGLEVSNGSPTQPRYSIRGVTTSDFGVGTDPAVGVYVDGIYSARSGASLLAFNDVERIEVVKGPQGTLYGRNSAAGAVAITTRKPSDKFEAEIGARVGEFNKRRLEGLINVPLSDTVAVRVNAVVNKRDGLFEDAATGQDYRTEDNWAVRGAVRWDLTPNLRAILTYTHDELDQDARPAIGLVTLPTAPGTPSLPADPATYINPFTAPILNDVVGNSEKRNLDEATLNVSYDLGEMVLTSLTSYRTFSTNNREDEDGTNRIETYFDTNNREWNDSYYQEFRLSGETGRFNWIAGTSYYNETADQRSDTFTYTDTINTILGNIGAGTPLSDIENFVLIPNDIPISLLGHGWSEDMINSGDFNAFAVFGDVIWAATDRLNLTAGLRYTRDEKTFSWLNGPRSAPEFDAALQALDDLGILGLVGASPDDFAFDIIFDLSSLTGVPCDNGVTVAEGVKCESSDSWSNVSPRFVADYKLTDDILLFGSYAKGYKAGGFNSVEVASNFDNEDVTNYEFGVKSTFPSANLLVNVSYFQYTYNDKQAISLVLLPGATVPQYVVETSDEEASGFDLETRWTPTDALSFFGNAQYIDVTYKDRVNRSGTDLSGEPTGVPEWSFAIGANYVLDLANHGDLEFSIAHAYEGECRSNSEALAQGGCSGAYSFDVGGAKERTDVRVFWRDNSGHYQVGGFVNNLFDNQYVDGINNLTTDTLGTPFTITTEPQIWGVDFKWIY